MDNFDGMTDPANVGDYGLSILLDRILDFFCYKSRITDHPSLT